MDKITRKIPAVGTLINKPEIKPLIKIYGRKLVTYSLRKVIDIFRDALPTSETTTLDIDTIVAEVSALIERITIPSLKPIINATGVVLHTNLGRAPLGEKILDDLKPIITGYSNVEFDLRVGCRGHRNEHIVELLRYLTGAENVLLVNNNAAAIILILHTFAKGKEVIISRGELIEIGGSFRIPEIMSAGGVKMVEVGTTNKTRLSDYEEALSPRTNLIFKAHKSNFTMSGFTEEVFIQDLTRFSHEHGLPIVYDVGSGLLRKPASLPLEHEPDVRSVIQSGVDLATFSCDKLLGGPQGGIIAGERALIAKLAKNPLLRALRVGKLTIGALISACRNYLSDETLVKNNPTFAMLEQSKEAIIKRAEKLIKNLLHYNIPSEITKGIAQVGGGTLPDLKMDSTAVRLIPPEKEKRKRQAFAENMFYKLANRKHPIVAVLREGNLIFEVFSIYDDDVPKIAEAVRDILNREPLNSEHLTKQPD